MLAPRRSAPGTRGGLVGARAVIDTHLRAYIEDVVVDRAHRRRGVATEMLERLLVELGATHLVSLFISCDSASASAERVALTGAPYQAIVEA